MVGGEGFVGVEINYPFWCKLFVFFFNKIFEQYIFSLKKCSIIIN